MSGSRFLCSATGKPSRWALVSSIPLTGSGTTAALSWRTITAGMINSQLHPNLCRIWWSTWKCTSPWGLGCVQVHGIHPRLLRELADVITGILLLMFQHSWESREVQDDWKLENVVLVLKKDKKKDSGNYRLFHITSMPDKIMEKIILGVTEKHLKDNAVIGQIQHSFSSRRSCLTSLISFYKITQLVGQRKPANVIFLEFNKAFDIVSHGLLLEKMTRIQLVKIIR